MTFPALDPGDEASWVASINWEWTPEPRTCELCGRTFTGRGAARTCSRCRQQCTHPSRLRGATIASDGVKRAVFACLMCGWLIEAPRSDPARWAGEHIFRDIRAEREGAAPTPCERCGATSGTQKHHWAPRAIFGLEAEQWPKSWLCPPCHSRWHRTMREAGGFRREQPDECPPFVLFDE